MESIWGTATDRLDSLKTEFADWAILRLSVYASKPSTTLIPEPPQYILEILPATRTASPPLPIRSQSQLYALLIFLLLALAISALAIFRFRKYTLACKASSQHLESIRPEDLTQNDIKEARSLSRLGLYRFLRNLHTQLSDTLKAYDNLKRKSCERETQHEHELRQLHDQILTKARQLTRSRNQTASLTEVIEQLDAEVDDLRSTVGTRESTIVQLSTSLDSAREDNGRKDGLIKETELELQCAQDQLVDCHSKRRSEQKRAIATMKEKEAGIEQLTTRLKQSESTSASHAKLLAVRDEKASQLNVKCEDQGRKIRSLSSEVISLQTASTDLQAEIATVKARLSDTTGRLSQKTQELDSLKVVSLRERNKLAAESRTRETIQEMLLKTHKALEPIIEDISGLSTDELYARAKGLENTLEVAEDTKEEVETLRQTAKDRQSQVTRLMATIDRMVVQTTELENALETASRRQATTLPSDASESSLYPCSHPWALQDSEPCSPVGSYSASKSNDMYPITSDNLENTSSHYTPPHSTKTTTTPHSPKNPFLASATAPQHRPYHIPKIVETLNASTISLSCMPYTPYSMQRKAMKSRFSTTPSPPPPPIGREGSDDQTTGMKPDTHNTPLSEFDLAPITQEEDAEPSYAHGLTPSGGYITPTDSSLSGPENADTDVFVPRGQLFKPQENAQYSNNDGHPRAATAGADVFTMSTVRSNVGMSRAEVYDALRRQLETPRPSASFCRARPYASSSAPTAATDATHAWASTVLDPIVSDGEGAILNEAQVHTRSMGRASDEERAENNGSYFSSCKDYDDSFSAEDMAPELSKLKRDLVQVFERARAGLAGSAVVGKSGITMSSGTSIANTNDAIPNETSLDDEPGTQSDEEAEESSPPLPQTPLDAGPWPVFHVHTPGFALESWSEPFRPLRTSTPLPAQDLAVRSTTSATSLSDWTDHSRESENGA
ncbi:hypothetical protein FRB95_011713 [Tulasnella sp. JGI-2019a]|nr:hypothetical protein FRB95_011713 [Tulasnella sp. JGI-2019a]